MVDSAGYISCIFYFGLSSSNFKIGVIGFLNANCLMARFQQDPLKNHWPSLNTESEFVSYIICSIHRPPLNSESDFVSYIICW